MKRAINSKSENANHDPETHAKSPERRYLHAGKLVVRMDILAYILIGLSGLVGLAAGIESYHHKSPSIWMSCVSGVLFVLSACCYWQDVEWKREVEEKQAEHFASLPATTASVHLSIAPALEKQDAKQDKAQESLNRIEAMMASYQKTHAPDLSEEFPLGYSLFTMKGREEVVPFTTPDNNMTFRWEHTTVNVSDDWITIITPEVSVPGFLQMKGQIVKLANKPGSIVRVIRIKDVGLVVKLMDADQNERIGVIGLMLYKLDPPHS